MDIEEAIREKLSRGIGVEQGEISAELGVALNLRHDDGLEVAAVSVRRLGLFQLPDSIF